MKRILILLMMSLVLSSCSKISVTQEELQKVVETALNDNIRKKVDGTTYAYWSNYDISFNKFDTVKMESNGVKTTAIPVKVKAKSIICAYSTSFDPNVTYVPIDDEITINVYRNEVKDLKYTLTDDKSNLGNRENYPCGISFDRGIMKGTIKEIDPKSSTIKVNATNGEYSGFIPNENMGKLLASYFRAGDRVEVHIDRKGPHAWDWNRVLYVQPEGR